MSTDTDIPHLKGPNQYQGGFSSELAKYRIQDPQKYSGASKGLPGPVPDD